MTLQYPQAQEAIQPQKVPEYSGPGEESKESVEKKNMLAVSEFVKKLETLVTDTGNTSNKTGHTLIHLKKFIIVPDNQTLWSVKQFAETGAGQQTTSAEEIIVMGEGAGGNNSNKRFSEDTGDVEQPANEADQKAKLDDSSLIKDIISSVIRGENLKRDVISKKPDECEQKSSNEQTIDVKACSDLKESGCKGSTGKQELDTYLGDGKNSENLVKQREETSAKGDGTLQNSERSPGDRFLERNPGNAKEPSRNDNIVCAENKSNVKEKREASPDSASLVSHKRRNKIHGKRKNAKYPKKKRRRKRKRKMKKKKGKRNEKNNKKSGSKWPFKRNLLMIPEKEQIEIANENYGTQMKGFDRSVFTV